MKLVNIEYQIIIQKIIHENSLIPGYPSRKTQIEKKIEQEIF